MACYNAFMEYSIFQPTDPSVVDGIKHIIKDKVVYDIGAGDGKFAMMMGEHAKRVVAVESNEMYAGDCRLRGLEVIQDDFNNIDLEPAEVIYIFMSLFGTCALTLKLERDNWHGTVVSQYYPLHTSLTPSGVYTQDETIELQLGNGTIPFLVYNI